MGLYLCLISVGGVAIVSDLYILFSAHLLLMFLHFPEVKKVLLSMYRPWRSLLLTFCLFIVIVYFFAVFAYADVVHYPENTCESLAQCFITTFDQGFKNDGGVGGFLD